MNPILHFSAAVRALGVVSPSTLRNYESGHVPMALRLVLAHPQIAAALARDARRMSAKDRAELRAGLKR